MTTETAHLTDGQPLDDITLSSNPVIAPDDYEILRTMMTEWVAAVYPPIAEFARAEKALEHFRKLLEKENG